MTDDELTTEWRAFDPTGDQRRRIDARLSAWLQAYDTSLAGEWLAMFRIAPIRTAGLVAASVLSILAATPVVWLARALL